MPHLMPSNQCQRCKSHDGIPQPGEDIRRIQLDVWAVPEVCAPHFLHDSVRVNTSLATILLPNDPSIEGKREGRQPRW
jgi:hypothetical protein